MTLPITIPLPIPFGPRVVNAYLLLGQPLTIVDPGVDSEQTEIELRAALGAHSLRLEDVEQIILTHQHQDHVGFAHRLKSLSGAEVVAHHGLMSHLARLTGESMESESRYHEALMRLHGVPEALIEERFERARTARRFVGSVILDRPVRDGDVVEAGLHRLIIRERPGHSPSDLVLVEERGRFALVGDHLLAGISPNPIAHLPLDGPADPQMRPPALALYLDSLRRTDTLEFAVGLPGHGPPVDDVHGLIEDRIEFHERRKDQIYACLGPSTLTAHEIAVGVWGETAVQQSFLTLTETLGHLDLLEAEHRVLSYAEDDGATRYLAVDR
jgi:glyoxylase-like metal-dependent hydrolase (beta-lactamase superfamily II)